MRSHKFTSKQELYNSLNSNQKAIIDNLRQIFDTYQTKESIQRNVLMHRFSNGKRCYLDTYKKEYVSLGIGHGKKLVDENPVLSALCDSIQKVVAKIYLHTPQDIEQKATKQIIELYYKL